MESASAIKRPKESSTSSSRKQRACKKFKTEEERTSAKHEADKRCYANSGNLPGGKSDGMMLLG